MCRPETVAQDRAVEEGMDEFYRSRFRLPGSCSLFGSRFAVRASGEPVARTAYDEARAAVADCVQFLTSQSTYAHFTSAWVMPLAAHGSGSTAVHRSARMAGVRDLQASDIPGLREGTSGQRLEAPWTTGRISGRAARTSGRRFSDGSVRLTSPVSLRSPARRCSSRRTT